VNVTADNGHPSRRRRSELAVPANQKRMVEGAFRSSADLIFLDLEDSIPESEKTLARSAAIHFLQTAPVTNHTVAVRVNGLDTAFGYEDIVDLTVQAGPRLDLLILPKITSADEMRWISRLLDQLERRAPRHRPIGVEVLIEDVKALRNVEEIALASERVEALIFGAWDYAASQGITTLTIPANLWEYPRSRIVAAASAAGIDCVDSACVSIDDTEVLAAEVARAGLMGFAGKWAIHPKQCELLNTGFAPALEDIVLARRVLKAYEDSSAKGQGAVRLDDLLVDAGTVRIMHNILRRVAKLGLD
jgi:citrate lyase subunit beta/citryl-CoA lyase